MTAPVAERPLSLWVTRPAEDAAELATALRAQGHAVLVEPLLAIEFIDGPPLNLDGVQAVLATSANGVRAFSARNAERSLPLLAVGDATARAARAAGFTHIESASGDVMALAELARQRLHPAAGALLHVAAGDLAGDLASALATSGFECRRAVLYRAHTAEALSHGTTALIHEGKLDGVLVFSPRTAATLARLLASAGLANAAAALDLFSLSAAVANAAANLPWRRVFIAAVPTQASLLDAVVAAATASMPSPDSGERLVAMDSLSSSGEFVGTLLFNSRTRDVGTGGMNSDDNKDQRPEASVAAATPEPPAPPPPDSGSAPPRADPWGSSREDVAAAGGSRPSKPPPGPPSASRPETTKRGPGPLIWALIALAVIAAGGAAAWFGYFEPRQQQAAQVPMVDPQQEVDTALDDLDAREAQLRKQVTAIAPRLDMLENTIGQLRQSVEELSQRAQQGDTELTSQLAERIARLESQAANATSLAQQVRSLEVTTASARDAASKLSTTVLGVGQLAQAVDGGGSFVRQLAAVRALGGDDPEIAQAAADLEAHAASGIPTLAALRARFPETADAVSRAEPVTAGDGWTDKVVDRLASLVNIRRTGASAIPGGGVDSILARAEIALTGGDLATAVAALQELSGAPAQAAADWLELARTRLQAERSLATLQQRAIARLSAARG